ncbi:10279_t:CDS:1, partial [Cetraspora pellucida]
MSQKQHNIWNFFPFLDGTKTTRQCSVCFKTYDEPLNQSTAKTHFFSNHPDVWERVKTRPGQKRRKENDIIYSDETSTTITTPPAMAGPSFSPYRKNDDMMVMDDSRKDEHQAVFFETMVESESSELMIEYSNIKIKIK